MKYRKKPVVVEVERFTGDNIVEIINWISQYNGNAYASSNPYLKSRTVTIVTLEGEMQASQGDNIIKGVHNEFYPCKPIIFEKTYERVIEVGPFTGTSGALPCECSNYHCAGDCG